MRQTCKSGRSMRGFTLIEMLVTLLVLAIILGFALPSFTDQIRNNRSLTFGEEFATALNYVRSEAVKRSGSVSVCASNDDGTDCGSDWTNGWLAFVDEAANTTDASVTVGEVLRYWDPANNEMTLEVTRGGSATDFVRFVSMGALARINNDNVPVNATAKHESCTGNAARAIRVGVSGSVQMRRVNC